MVIDLKPCPFCGGEPMRLMRTYTMPSETYLVYCQDCNAEGQPCRTEAEAVEAWNRRATPWKE